ncbi:MAG TPA: cation:proton antiporter [Gammaproteobacteria bacterium]|nr:cation:proton antiporter [Gammaproteobacteria bacterium]
MHQPDSITYIIFLIFTGTAVLSTLALFTRQSLLVAYIALGALLGPWGLKLIDNTTTLQQIGDVGIIFLLFLLGLHLQPQNLFHSLRKMSLITLISSVMFFAIAYIPSYLFGYSSTASIVIGITAMFSSTIIGIKLLPTTILHHQHTGELLVSILLLQDMIAIITILFLEIMGGYSLTITQVGLIIVAFPVLLIIAYIFAHFILAYLLERFDKIHEYIFILSIGWCLCMGELSRIMGLSEEIGAFIAGIALASNPIAFYIAESLKPLRDFFLVLFFFTIGAGFNFGYLPEVAIAACTLAGLMLILKPIIFNWLLQRSGELKKISWEIGVRLGQMSEFSLLVIYMTLEAKILPPIPAYMAEAAIIITFIVSCYWTVMRYPTPLATSENLRRD